MTRVLYLHGLYSRPGGFKPTYLASAGFDVINPHLPDDDFEESVRRAQSAFDAAPPDVVVGSSRGGAVAIHIATGDVPVILIAPAWKRWGSSTTAPPRTVILHAEADAVVPIDWSRALIRNSGLPADALQVVGLDHNMTDPEALGALLSAIREVTMNPPAPRF